MPLSQFINFFAALFLLLSFAMLTQRRTLSLIRLLAWQGLLLAINIGLIAYVTKDFALYFSVILTLCLKVWFVPFILRRLLLKLNMHNEIEQLINVPVTLLMGIVIVIFAFDLSLPITQLTTFADNKTILAFALACVLLSTLMMIVKRNAISQVVGLMALENSLFFAATSLTYSLPIVVELGIAFDVLIGLFIFGLFFFQIRDTFDSLDIKHLEKLRDE